VVARRIIGGEHLEYVAWTWPKGQVAPLLGAA
jgi:hypothetical protein